MSPSDQGAAVTWSAYTADRPAGEPIHAGYGHDSAAALIAVTYLCCGRITVQPFTE
jgi:hypothetical protein